MRQRKGHGLGAVHGEKTCARWNVAGADRIKSIFNAREQESERRGGVALIVDTFTCICGGTFFEWRTEHQHKNASSVSIFPQSLQRLPEKGMSRHVRLQTIHRGTADLLGVKNDNH